MKTFHIILLIAAFVLLVGVWIKATTSAMSECTETGREVRYSFRGRGVMPYCE